MAKIVNYVTCVLPQLKTKNKCKKIIEILQKAKMSHKNLILFSLYLGSETVLWTVAISEITMFLFLLRKKTDVQKEPQNITCKC